MRDDRPWRGAAPPGAVYFYSPDRKGEHPRQHLAKFKGTLQADGYAGFNELYAAKANAKADVVEAACWAHARRKFHDIHVAGPSPIAEEALRRIGELYSIEDDIRGQAAEDRRAARQARSKPLVARGMGYVDTAGEVKPPFRWDEDRRLHLRAKLDAVFFHLYGVTDRDDVRYVHATFPIVERQETEASPSSSARKQRLMAVSRELSLAYVNAPEAGDPDAEMRL